MAAANGKTPKQLMDAEVRRLKNALAKGAITKKEYEAAVKEAAIKWAGKKEGAGAAVQARRLIEATTAKAKTEAAKTVAKKLTIGGIVGGVARGAAKGARNPYVLAATVAGPWAYDKVKAIGAGMQKQAAGAKVPTSSVDKALGQAGARVTGRKVTSASKTATAGRGRSEDTGSTSRIPKALTPAQKAAGGSTAGASRGTHIVKRGDTLWGIAQKNNTTVSALLKANPTIAKRKAEGKVTIFSGSKVRIPKGK